MPPQTLRVMPPRMPDNSHRQALAHLEHVASSDDSQAEEYENDGHNVDASSIIDISIGYEQNRLKSPATPAADKAAALDGQDPFDVALSQQPTQQLEDDKEPEREPEKEPERVTRPRAGTDRKLGPFNIPTLNFPKSIPRLNIPSIDDALSWARGDVRVERQAVDKRQASPARSLRRSNSDSSLALWRTTSRAPSMGDDSRWEGIHEQVNSRMKAIRDSWADTNISFKLPTPSLAMLRPREKEEPKSRIWVANGQYVEPSLRAREQIALGAPSRFAATHPQLTKALEDLTGDVVVLGGYRGSILRSSEPPNRQLWVPIKVGLNLRKVNLEVGLEFSDEVNMHSTIKPSGMLKNIGPVDISRKLFKRLSSCENAVTGKLRVWDYGYDWRLSPHLLAEQLTDFLQGLPCNKPDVPESERGATVIAHSLGGLLTRHAVNDKPELFRSVVYAGVPIRCVNILGPLRNGDDVLLSSRVLTAQVNFTIRTSFALLPLDGDCFENDETGEKYNVDFFDPQNWDEYRLSPCIARALPPAKPVDTGVVSSLRQSVSHVVPGRKMSTKLSSTTGERGVANEEPVPRMDHMPNPQENSQDEQWSVSTAVTIPKDVAQAYLKRTLADVKRFKEELEYRPENHARYPPAAVIYGKSIPTVCGARVKSREAIKNADAYENLKFASGDGVVLARAAQLPNGYANVAGGTVPSDRGHISLLGDLEAVGQCLNAIGAEQRKRRRRQQATAEADGPMDKVAQGSEDGPKHAAPPAL